MNLLARSRRRRRKQLRRITITACCISIFLCGSMLYQGHMKPYQRQVDFKNYGQWILRLMLPEGREGLTHPYLEESGEIATAVHIYGEPKEESGKDKEEAEDTGYYLGTVSQEAEEMGNFSLYEGRMPQNENEIVMELGVLNRLGYSYELGQQITLSCGKHRDETALILQDRRQEFETVTYTLVGTLENYTAKWAKGEVLPSAIVSREAFQKLDCESVRYVFYSLKEEYQDINALEFVTPLMKEYGIENPVESVDDTLVYNDYVYEHHVWGGETQSRNITLTLMVMGSCAMVYLISSYQKKRRRHYYQLRCIGATKWQVRKFSVMEMLMTVLPAGLGGVLFSYLMCFGITEWIAGRNQYASFFEFRWGLFGRIMAVIFLTFFAALLLSQILLGDSRISIQKRTIGKAAKRRLRRKAAKNKPLRAGTIAGRKDALYRLPNICIRIAGIAVCTVVFYSLSRITEQQMLYQGQCAFLDDAAVQTGTTFRRFRHRSFADFDMNLTMGEQVEKDFQTLIGIEEINYFTSDTTHSFQWAGKESSDYYQQFQEEVIKPEQPEAVETEKQADGESDNPSILPEEWEEYEKSLFDAVYYANPHQVWEDFAKQLSWEGADYEKFAAGEQILLCASSLDYNSLDGEEETSLDEEESPDYEEDAGFEELSGDGEAPKQDESLKPGTELWIPTKNGKVRTVLAGIVDPVKIIRGWHYNGNGGYHFLCAENLGKQIASRDGIRWGHNKASFRFNRMADAEATGKQLSVLAVANRLTMTSDFEAIQKTWRETWQTLLLYGSFSVMLLSIFLLLRSCMLRDLFLKEQESYQKLHQIGMSKAALLKMSVWRGIREGISYLAALPLALGLVMHYLWQSDKTGMISFLSFRLEREFPYTNRWTYVKYKLLDNVDPLCWLLFVVLMIVVTTLLYYLHMKWILKEEGRRHE